MSIDHLPQPIIEDLIELTLRDRRIAYLEVSSTGLLLSAAGELAAFGLSDLKTAKAIEAQVDFLTGLLEPETLPVYLPFMQIHAEVTVDIHIFLKDQRVWVLLMDTEEKRKHHQSVQQVVYNLRLNHNRQSSIIDQHLGKQVVERLERSMQGIQDGGERRVLSIMFADLRGFTRFSEKSAPETVFEVLNSYLSSMIPVVLANAGVVDKIIGDEVMAVFGMDKQRRTPSQCAIDAALHMLVAVESLNRSRQQQRLPQLQIGIGIATGPVSLGVLGSQRRKSLTVIGSHVNLAARLQHQAQGRHLVVDQNTYKSANSKRLQFTPERVSLKGFSADMNVFRFDLEQLADLEQRVNQYEDDPTLY